MKHPFVADLKRNCLDDGPGIRSTVFFKGCPLSCSWCHNPECIRAFPELMYREATCIDCRDCVQACRQGAIGPNGPQTLDRARCRRAGHCTDECPSGALEIVGRRYELEELVRRLARDRTFYDNSGGGVTLSGGEATMYCEYAGALAQRLRERGVHVLLETCGHFDWDRFEAHLLPHVDAVYFDLKLLDPAAHERYCGRDNALIIANADRLVDHCSAGRPELLFRVPLVAKVTTTEDNLHAVAAFLGDRGVERIALLPYNPLWFPKARSIGSEVASYLSERFLSESDLARARQLFDGFEVV